MNESDDVAEPSVEASATIPSTADEPVEAPPRPPILRSVPRLAWRTTEKCYEDSIIGWAAQAAFWQALSLPPLILGVLGSIGYIAGWFGPDTIEIISQRIMSFADRTFSDQVVTDLIEPTVDNVLGRGRVTIMSVSFVLSLWAGSSAMSCFVSSIVHAHGQHQVRHPVWQRIFALIVYIVFLIVAIFVLPLVALGPTYLQNVLPESWGPAVADLVDWAYFPFVGVLLIGALSMLYRFALPYPPPRRRLVPGAILAGVGFWLATYVLRAYLTTLAQTGYTYGALATPIAFLLFTYFLGFAIVLGAEFNAACQEFWPSRTSAPVMRHWVTTQTTEITDTLRNRAAGRRGSRED